MSNRPHERYSKVWFDENWLEQFVSDVMEIPIDVCYSKSLFRGDRGKRAIFFYALHKYAGMSVTRISKRYSQSPEDVRQLLSSSNSGYYAVTNQKLTEALSKYMPLRQFETYKD